MRRLHIYIFILLSIVANAQHTDKISDHLKEAMLSGFQHDIIILMEEQTDINTAHIKGKYAKAVFVYETLADKAVTSQRTVRTILENHGADYHTYNVVNALSLKANNNLIEELAAQKTVRRVLYDPWFKIEQSVATSKPLTQYRMADTTYGVKMINAPAVWEQGITGQGITVAGQDTGYDWNIDPLRSKYRGWNSTDSTADHNYHWHDAIHEISPLHGDTMPSPDQNPCGLDALEPCDDNNHGTHTMGTMVGSTDEEAIGVAPDAKWIGCRSLERGWGKLSTYTECFEFFLAPTDLNGENPKPELAPHVINNSWYCPAEEGCTPDTWEVMQIVMENIKASGTMLVVSAGNSGPGCSTIEAPPAIFETAFTVGAVAADSIIANFSSRGPLSTDSTTIAPHVVAPGVQVRSVIRGGVFQNNSGTSMSGPHVAGMAALLFSSDPQFEGEVSTIENVITSSTLQRLSSQDCSSFLGDEVPNAVYGHGIVDVFWALESLKITSTEETQISGSIKVYPNPTTQSISLEVTDEVIENILVTDISGKTIVNRVNVKNSLANIDLHGQPSGLYIYKVATANHTYSGKISKL